MNILMHICARCCLLSGKNSYKNLSFISILLESWPNKAKPSFKSWPCSSKIITSTAYVKPPGNKFCLLTLPFIHQKWIRLYISIYAWNYSQVFKLLPECQPIPLKSSLDNPCFCLSRLPLIQLCISYQVLHNMSPDLALYVLLRELGRDGPPFWVGTYRLKTFLLRGGPATKP